MGKAGRPINPDSKRQTRIRQHKYRLALKLADTAEAEKTIIRIQVDKKQYLEIVAMLEEQGRNHYRVVGNLFRHALAKYHEKLKEDKNA